MNTELAEFLASERCPEGTMILPELYGFLFAVSCSPEPISPSEWLPLVFSAGDPNYLDESEVDKVIGAIFDAYEEVNEAVLSGKPTLPDWCQLAEQPIENFGEEHPVNHWCVGFLSGHDWLHNVWEKHVSSEESDELAACLMTLSFFSSRKLAEDFCAEASTGSTVLVENLAESMADYFISAMASYASIGRMIGEALHQVAHAPYEREAPKVGRNEPCPCGSGKKYKKCCGLN